MYVLVSCDFTSAGVADCDRRPGGAGERWSLADVPELHQITQRVDGEVTELEA